MTPEQIDALPVYTDAQLAKLYRYGLQRGWAGTRREIDNQSVEFPPPDKILDVIERLEARAAAANGSQWDGVSLVRFGTPR